MKIQDQIINKINQETSIYWSLNELSEKTGIHPSYLIKIRNWKQKLSLKMISKLKLYFGL